jgi:predicted lipoprotein
MDIHMIFRRRPTGVMTAVMLVAVLLTAALAGCSKVPGIYVYEKAGSAQSGGAKAFDPKTYVDGIWASKIIPTVQQKAVDVTAVSAAIDKDPEAAGKQYGTRSGTGSPYAFMVKGAGTVIEIDKSVPTGPMTVQVGDVKLTIATGPVIAGTALRDAVGFISFGDFTNQIDYAEVANQINGQVKTDVIAKVDLATVKGKKVEFYGAFANLTPGTIFLVPTELTVAP